MISQLKEIGPVSFPPNTGERVYMVPFKKQYGLPSSLTRWQPIVDSMLIGIETDNPIYLMIDQGRVRAGKAHRRPGPHIDGTWNPEVNIHGHTEWEMSEETILMASDVEACCAYVGKYEWNTWNTWNKQIRSRLSMPGDPRSDGDCGHVNLSGLKKVMMKANVAYAGNAAMIHESLPVKHDCQRTLVRLNVSGVPFVLGSEKEVANA